MRGRRAGSRRDVRWEEGSSLLRKGQAVRDMALLLSGGEARLRPSKVGQK